MKERTRFTVALLPWGDLIEDYLDSIGVSLGAFCDEMTGGWLFGYVEALHQAGVQAVIVCVSDSVPTPVRRTHRPTGAAIWILPAPKRYLFLRSRMRNPLGWTAEEIFGKAHGVRSRLQRLMRDIAPYTATPLGPLARVLRQESCDVILCQEYEYARFDLCVALGKMLGVPAFATFQGGDVQFSRLESLLRPWAIHNCAGLIIAAETEANRVRSTYEMLPSRIACIFNPLDLRPWTPVDGKATRKKLGFPDSARVAAWHGRVEIHRKGIDVLLDAWRAVTENYPEEDLRLLMIGTGSDAAELRRRLASDEVPGVVWIDDYILDRTALRDYLAAADVYVFPSRHEGFPSAPIEAMACGLPVVAAAAPGVRDILENGEASGGVVVPRDDAPALVSALSSLLSDDDRCRSLGTNARRRAHTSFSLESVGRKLAAFLADRCMSARA